jgi:PGF-CTERM protein
MTKRLTMTLVALVLFVLLAVMPAAAIRASPQFGLFNGSVILNGAPTPTVFIGEDQLNLTPALTGGTYIVGAVGASSPASFKIGWWAPGTFSYPNNPSQTVDVSASLNNFAVTPAAFGSYTGTWYCLTANSTTALGPIFIVADPSQAIQAWDVRANAGLGQDMTGKSVVRGSVLSFKVDTNLVAFTAGGRGNNRMRIGEGWNNGTMTAVPQNAAVITSLLWVSTQPGLNSGFSNGTTVTAPAQGSMLTFTNWSNWSGNVMGVINYTRTYNFNNSPYATADFNNLMHAQNITTDAAGLVDVLTGGPGEVNFTASGITPAIFYNFPNAAVDGIITIRLKDESGQVASRVYTSAVPMTSVSLLDRWINTQPQFPIGDFNGANGLTALGWDTAAIDAGLGTPLYPAGTYTVWTETSLGKLRDNYKLGGADYTGKTVSASGTVTLVSDTVKIEANKETVVRSKPFAVTITGRPLTQYFIWVKGTSSMRGGYDDQPPMVGLFQAGMYNDTPTYPAATAVRYPIGIGYQYQNAVNNRVIRNDVATDQATATNAAGVAVIVNPYNSTRYYVMINTSASGTRTIEFVTTNMTKAQTYTIRVEQNFPITTAGYPTVQGAAGNNDFKSDEVDVKVEKGAVTITASGDQSYYLGEEIKFSGTNTETQTTFLFITGPNLNTQGSSFTRTGDMDIRRTRIDNVATDARDNIASDYIQRPVNADNTWDWKWGTANWALDAGTYTVYAVSGPRNAQNLAQVAYGTVSIIIKKPFISATASQSTVAQGDKVFITGTAEGKPQTGIAIWILGKNYALRVTQSVNSDASFSYEVTTATTTLMDAGQYFVVAQHPMQNQQFDVAMCAGSNTQVCNLQQATLGNQQIFTLLGAGSLQGTDAAEALVQGINSPNVDDTYTKLVFLVEVPSIRIDPIGDRHVGDKFTITATTNLAVDDEVQMTVVSSSFKPTQKSQSGEFSGASGTIKVTKGDTGLNKLSFDVDASTFKPDEYIVTANRILLPASTATALFNVLEGAAPTAVPTKVVTTAAPTGAPTTVATPIPTATPAKTPTQPGFGALVALIGLGAVAFFVVRRH